MVSMISWAISYACERLKKSIAVKPIIANSLDKVNVIVRCNSSATSDQTNASVKLTVKMYYIRVNDAVNFITTFSCHCWLIPYALIRINWRRRDLPAVHCLCAHTGSMVSNSSTKEFAAIPRIISAIIFHLNLPFFSLTDDEIEFHNFIT